MVSGLVESQVVAYGLMEELYDGNEWGATPGKDLWTHPYFPLLVSAVFVLTPLYAIGPLRKAKAAGVLHSRSFEARYGWLCSRRDTTAFS